MQRHRSGAILYRRYALAAGSLKLQIWQESRAAGKRDAEDKFVQLPRLLTPHGLASAEMATVSNRCFELHIKEGSSMANVTAQGACITPLGGAGATGGAERHAPAVAWPLALLAKAPMPSLPSPLLLLALAPPRWPQSSCGVGNMCSRTRNCCTPRHGSVPLRQIPLRTHAQTLPVIALPSERLVLSRHPQLEEVF